MIHSTTRRGFLRAAAAFVAAELAACGREDPPPPRSGPVPLERPVLEPFGEGAVRIATPLDVRPVAYVSMATREVFVDRDHRDRASWLLGAHISVSTWVWRIPLPGDSPLTPIPPGDEPREFEELPIDAWNPSVEPADGDVRIVLGRRARVELSLDCAPVQGPERWLSADSFAVERCVPAPGRPQHVGAPPREPVREDFRRLAGGRLHLEPDCADEGAPTDVFGWACG